MYQKITEGVKISVKSKFEGTYFDGETHRFIFTYSVEIKNNNSYAVQLMSRNWKILDCLNNTETVEGKGVVGELPVIMPMDFYKYESGCSLIGPIGTMSGSYKMIRLDKSKRFDVIIPKFKLCANFTKN